ncbi:hypothetical protein HPB52_021410 [Rhipicephalus sanguineus]|uniref:Uncharacterized protein n=1 Tax=Rhipicephalus sanguineus TaxID=34632 RepID=A0A9D4PDS1_RHISA|nr:hypothetical protein HPB52_021410 [Rhipicephalus sanguineus]
MEATYFNRLLRKYWRRSKKAFFIDHALQWLPLTRVLAVHDLFRWAPKSVPCGCCTQFRFFKLRCIPGKIGLSLPPPWVIATLPAETPVEGAPPTDDRRQRLVAMF